MRSSIACSRCRRSKIKCVNAGIDTTCRACESSGRECSYPIPAPGGGTGGTKRDIAASGDGDDRNGEWDSPKRQRSRKSTNATTSGAKDAIKPTSNVLDSPILTVKVWETLFEFFQLHFSTILPFLHPTAFLTQIRQLSSSSAQQDGQPPGDHSQSPGPASETSPLVLLGVLTLTARFHPQLTSYHCPPSPVAPCNPLVASEFYANALRSRLSGTYGADLTSTDISRVQALLMLSLHEWGMCRGKNAWVYLGMAIRLAQAADLSFEQENDQPQQRTPLPGMLNAEVEPHDQRGHTSDDVIEQETRRRTFWSCFMLDRYLSSGKYRPRVIKIRDVEIQLPSDNAFAFGERVRTSRLNDGLKRRFQNYESRGIQIPSLRNSMGYGENAKLRPNGPSDLKQWSSTSHRSEIAENSIDRWEMGAEECVLGRLVRMVRIWGSIAKWSCSGNRRLDQHPPWHPDSRFSPLRQLLVEFHDGLSRNLQYTQRNTDTHIMYKNSLAPYSLIHILYFLSVIVLHRAYLPFLPLRYPDPQGPLDEPCYPFDKYLAPEAFWRESARELFNAARQMTELVKTCQERGVLMETPVVGFAIYNAALVGVYAAHFNQMDQEGYLCSKPGSTDVVPGLGCQGQVDVRRVIEILGEMRPRLKMAGGWFRTIHRVHGYFTKARRDLKRNSRQPDTLNTGTGSENDIRTSNGRAYGVRELAHTGSSDELKLLDKLFLDLGNAEDQVAEKNGPDEDGTAGSANLVERKPSDVGSTAVKSESADGLDSHADGVSSTRRESWVPVNSVNSPVHGPLPSSAPEHDNPISRPRPLENDRWPNLAPPQPQCYPLPSLQLSHSLPSSTASNNPPPSLTSPGSYASSTHSSTAPSTSSQQLSAALNRLQPIQPWNTFRKPPPAPYSQSLPSLSAAAPHSFPMPPLPGTQQLHLNPPRFDAPPRPYSAGSANTPSGSSSPGWMSCLGGDDVIFFIEGASQDQWPSSTASLRGLTNGWLSTVWCESGQ
ncbi:conserved hypothetical protein [Histoplasma capsulatum G186AR]|uniref:Zn(2)-C6 fungal-type domain-containing protein n=2 Tax=Ajellomyces capsulatus TaxID=5037 RepID=C0NP46_AJECG|nr:uncharacterized protein HCBG_04926 [Histoplasma capsulatum G186AR]EEH06706.1 conserved hypothetical protein [Histoplasma capsulatum G186AR]